MRGLAKVVSTVVLGLGSFGALILLLAGIASFDEFGSSGWLLVGFSVATFVGSATSACVVSLLASIDERLQLANAPLSRPVKSKVPKVSDAPLGVFATSEELDDDLDSKSAFDQTYGRS